MGAILAAAPTIAAEAAAAVPMVAAAAVAAATAAAAMVEATFAAADPAANAAAPDGATLWWVGVRVRLVLRAALLLATVGVIVAAATGG